MDVNDCNGNTPLILSYKKGDLKIFNYLLEFLDVNQKDGFGNTVLHYAIINEDTNIIKKLIINFGSNLYLKNNYNKSPIEIAFFQSNYYVLKILIEHGNIDVNIKNSEGIPILIIIIKSKKLNNTNKNNLIKLLIEKVLM